MLSGGADVDGAGRAWQAWAWRSGGGCDRRNEGRSWGGGRLVGGHGRGGRKLSLVERHGERVGDMRFSMVWADESSWTLTFEFSFI